MKRSLFDENSSADEEVDAGGGSEDEEEDEEEEDEDRRIIRENAVEELENDIDDFVGEGMDDDVINIDIEESGSELGGGALSTDVRSTFTEAPRHKIIGLISILNIVVTAYLTIDEKPPFRISHIHLMDLIRRGSALGFQLNKKKFAAAILSLINPNCCVLIFERGKIVCAGCTNIEDATRSIDYVIGKVSQMRTAYSKLHAVCIKVRNMVGTTCFPNTINIEALHRENQNVVEGEIANGVRMAPPPMPNVGLNRKEQVRRAGSTLVYKSGYVLIIGTAKPREAVYAFHRAFPIISRYFDATAEAAFSAEKIRRYYTYLKMAFEKSEMKPSSFIAVRANGTQGTIEEWIESQKVEESIVHFKALTENPERAGMRAVLKIDREETIKAIEENKRRKEEGKALIVRDAPQANSSVVNYTGNALVKVVDTQMKTAVIRAAEAHRRVNEQQQRQSKALRVLEHGAAAVIEEDKPKQIQILSLEEASKLYSGQRY